jgi:glycosyltransferase involved in cell wall biosynthesis
MKILVVDHNAICSSDRGLYRELHRMPGLEIALLVPSFWEEHFGPSRFEPEVSSLPVHSGKTLFTSRSHRVMYFSLGKLLKRLQPDILYVNSEPEGYLAWQSVKLRARICPEAKVIIDSWRNIDYRGKGFPYKLSWVNVRAERAVLSRADHCVAHTDRAKEVLWQLGFTRVAVIPPPVDTSVFKRSERSGKEQLGLSKFTIGFVGRFVPLKGVDLLLRAAQKLEFEYQILLVGSGPAKSEWLALARELNIHDRIVWKDPVPHSEVPSLLSAMDVLVLPSSTGQSWKEQFGRVLIEAMACEVPVIGSSSGEIPNVIGDAGLIFAEGEAEDLGVKLIQLYEHVELRRQLGVIGFDRVGREFSIPVIAERYWTLFRKLLNRPVS